MNGDYKDSLDYAILSFPGSELQNRSSKGDPDTQQENTCLQI